jgi:hypothetical protein
MPNPHYPTIEIPIQYAEEGLPNDVTVPPSSNSSNATRGALFPGSLKKMQTATSDLR